MFSGDLLIRKASLKNIDLRSGRTMQMIFATSARNPTENKVGKEDNWLNLNS